MPNEWSTVWPRKPGVYLFYGYIINAEVEPIPRLHLVTIEYVSKLFGIQYRTGRYTIKRDSGAYGVWMRVFVPDALPEIDIEAAKAAGRSQKPIKEVSFVE